MMQSYENYFIPASFSSKKLHLFLIVKIILQGRDDGRDMGEKREG
jgi:hypothetical protein